MAFIHDVFWICVGIIFYSYFGYGILLLIITRFKHLIINLLNSRKVEKTSKEDACPEVTLLVAAYNEEDIIEAKIENTLLLSYPPDKLNILFITDGSDDKTSEIIRRYPQIQILHQPARKGKTAALNRAMSYVTTPITIFCDANTLLNKSAIRKIVSHYHDERTGGVAGEKKILTRKDSEASGISEGLYWRYESLLKQLDAQLYTVIGAAGELFSIRTALWEDLPEKIILDDFVISIRINLKGYRIAYEPAAYASELPSASINEEKKRKVRISAGAFQAMVHLVELFNFYKHPVIFFQFFSHRFLRWTLTPLCFPILLITNALIAALDQSIIFKITLFAQLLSYGLAVAGAYSGSNRGLMKIAKTCHYILFMNISVYLGFIRFVQGTQTALWDKAQRSAAHPPSLATPTVQKYRKL